MQAGNATEGCVAGNGSECGKPGNDSEGDVAGNGSGIQHFHSFEVFDNLHENISVS